MFSFGRWVHVGLALSLLAGGPVAFGQKMYKCADGKGGTTFQQSPCPETAQEAEVRAKEKERLEAEAARKKEEDARKKVEAAAKAKERDAAYEKQLEERAAAARKTQEAQRKAMEGTTLEASADGSLPAGVEAIYPAPWKEDAHAGIRATFGKKQIQGCSKFRYRGRGGGSSEFLVQCPSSGSNWVNYFVWPQTDSVRGPYNKL